MVIDPLYGVFSRIIYLLVGAFGSPVFARAVSGPLVPLAPTGGYLLAFPVAAFLGCLVSSKRGSTRKGDIIRLTVSPLVNLVMTYTIGVLGLSLSLGIGPYDASQPNGAPYLGSDSFTTTRPAV